MSFNKQPNLIDDGYITGINNKMKSGTMTSETNMMPECFANIDKLIPEDERVFYQNYKEDDDDEEEGGTKLDDDNIYNTKPNVFVNKQDENRYNKPSEKSKHSEASKHSNSAHETTEASASAKEKDTKDPDDESGWSEEELLLRKMHMLRQLGELAQAGVKLSQNYSMAHDYKTMKFEYELHTGIRAKSNAVSWMSGMMILMVKGVEMLNDNYNPFDIKFENTWSNNVSTDINSYYDVLGEIYEKYTKPGQKMAPELKLFLMLSGSAITIQMHKGIKKLIPQVSQNLNDDPNMVENLRKDAELRQKREQEQHEKIEKEHMNASAKVADLRQLNAYKAEHTKMQQRAETSEAQRLANDLGLSDTESAKPPTNKKKDNQLPQPQMQQNFAQLQAMQQMQFQNQQLFLQKQADENRRKELIEQNNKLEQIGEMLKNMNAEESFVEHHIKQAKQAQPPQKPKTIKGLPEKALKRTSSAPSSPKFNLTDSDNISKISKASSKSSSSRISINPKLDEMLADEKSNKSNNSSQSHSKKSSGSKKSGIVMNIDDDLDGFNLDESSNDSLNIVNTKEENDEDDFPETISYGRKSTNSGKRGRPPKNITKIKIGK